MPSRNELNARARVLGIDPSTYANDSKLEQKLLWAEKNATAFTGTLATGTLTSDATAQADGDKVLIGDITYTFKTALSETKASSTLTSDATNVDEADRVTIDGVTYTFRATPTNPYDVDIGASAAASLDNLKAAINDSGTEGTTYGTGTAAHPTVTAEANTDTTQEVTARNFGTYANNFVTTETSAHLAWDGTSLGGSGAVAGVNAVPYQVLLGANAAAMLDNLKVAINKGATEGTNYSTGTEAHPQVTATTNTDTTQVVEAIDYSVTNASVATTDPTDTGSHMSWGAATLASGVADVNAVPSANASGVKDTNAGIAGDKNV